MELGRLYGIAGDLSQALAAALEAEKTALSDRDRSVGFNEIGDVLVAQGNLPGALERYTRQLEIAEGLAAGDPGNSGWQRDVSVSLWKLTAFPDSGIRWRNVVDRMEAMDQRGILLPTDRGYLEHARAQATAEPKGNR